MQRIFTRQSNSSWSPCWETNHTRSVSLALPLRPYWTCLRSPTSKPSRFTQTLWFRLSWMNSSGKLRKQWPTGVPHLYVTCSISSPGLSEIIGNRRDTRHGPHTDFIFVYFHHWSEQIQICGQAYSNPQFQGLSPWTKHLALPNKGRHS